MRAPSACATRIHATKPCYSILPPPPSAFTHVHASEGLTSAMKRGREIGATRHKRAAMVRLNVGGAHFDTTRDTLARCEYFEAYLSGRMTHAEDVNGRLFIDRSGSLFAHLLQFMRTSTLPSRKLTRDIKHELIHECEFFGMPHMMHHLNGEISPYDMRPMDRTLKDVEGDYSCTLLDVFMAEKAPQDPAELQTPLLPCSVTPQHLQPVASYSEFRQRFDKIAGCLLNHIADTRGIVLAGGCVLGALVGTPIGDIDIFLCCNHAQAPRITARVFEAVQSIHMGSNGYDLLVTRSNNAITFFRVVS